MSETVNRTICDLYRRQCERFGDRVAVHYPTADGFASATNNEMAVARSRVAAGLLEAGVRTGDRVAILADTSIEWMIADGAILAIGAVVVGIYPTSTAEQTRYIMQHCGARVLIAENAEQAAKCYPRDEPLAAFLIAPDAAQKNVCTTGPKRTDFQSFDLLSQLGQRRLENDPDAVDARSNEVDAEDVATLIYTSGTTGPPKAVALRHRHLHDTALASRERLQLTESDSSVVFLPLAHSFQRVSCYAGMSAGLTGTFAASIPQVSAAIKHSQPTILASVPRVFEKICAKIMQQVSERSALERRIFASAMSVGKQYSQKVRDHAPVPRYLELAYTIFDRMLFRKLRAQTLGVNVRFCISGGAPLSIDLLEFFHAIGILILEGYGLTETSAPATCNTPNDFRFGSVGKPLAGTEIKIAKDGEILIKGPGVFDGYDSAPDATDAAFDGAWFKSGDIGELNDGYLRITDRKKDIIVTAGGKNVAPQNIESHLRAHPLIDQAMVHGDQRKYLVALLTISRDELSKFARDRGLSGSDAELIASPAVEDACAAIVKAVNEKLASYESIKRHQLIDGHFSVETDMLTPTLKLRRREIERVYRETLDGLYA